MIMTQNKLMDGYRTLKNKFGTSPEIAAQAMAIAQEFCKNQKCPDCATGAGGCVDCKGRQIKEYKMNSGGFYYGHADEKNEDGILETIQEMSRAMRESVQIKKNLKKNIEDLKIKVAERTDLKVGDSFFKKVDKINKSLANIVNLDNSAMADRLDLIENKFKNSGSKSYNKIFDITNHSVVPLPKRKTFLTRYERGCSWTGNELARQLMN
jgi:hypothetical protein